MGWNVLILQLQVRNFHVALNVQLLKNDAIANDGSVFADNPFSTVAVDCFTKAENEPDTRTCDRGRQNALCDDGFDHVVSYTLT